MNKVFIVILAIVVGSIVSFLVLRRKDNRTYDDPANVLFSMPTIFERAPAVDSSQQPPGDGDFVIHEDNWRQIEFVPRQNLPALTNLLADVVAFEKANRESSGWKDTFARKEYATPLESLHLSFQKLLAALAPGQVPSLVFLNSGNFNALVIGGFSLRVKGLGILYGRRAEDRILELGFERDEANPTDRIGLSKWFAYCDENQLVMVDWYLRKIVTLAANAPPAK